MHAGGRGREGRDDCHESRCDASLTLLSSLAVAKSIVSPDRNPSSHILHALWRSDWGGTTTIYLLVHDVELGEHHGCHSLGKPPELCFRTLMDELPIVVRLQARRFYIPWNSCQSWEVSRHPAPFALD